MLDDWRLDRGQETYLTGAALIHQPYEPSDPSNDHDHCEFCMVKFGNGVDDLRCGYSTEDRYIWICPQCYNDFKEMFHWNAKEKTG